MNTNNAETLEMHTESDLLTPREACKELGSAVKEKTLANWRCQGKGPDFVKIGGRIMYARTALDAFKSRSTVKLTADA